MADAGKSGSGDRRKSSPASVLRRETRSADDQNDLSGDSDPPAVATLDESRRSH
jgi:hypothetical protein